MTPAWMLALPDDPPWRKALKDRLIGTHSRIASSVRADVELMHERAAALAWCQANGNPHKRDSRLKREAPRRKAGSARKGESGGGEANRPKGSSMTISKYDELVERLLRVESDDIGGGLANNWPRNPDGPEAAAAIEALSARPDEQPSQEGLVEELLALKANLPDRYIPHGQGFTFYSTIDRAVDALNPVSPTPQLTDEGLAEVLSEALAVIAYEDPDEPWRVAHDALKATARPLRSLPNPKEAVSGDGGRILQSGVED